MLKIKNSVGGSGGKDIIAFQIGSNNLPGNIYYAESGMTWEEFVNSKYNIDSYFSLSGSYISYGYTMVCSTNSYSNRVITTDVIESKYRYYSINSGGIDN